MTIIRRLLSAALIFSLCLVLTACGSGVEGSWKLTGGNAIGAIYSLDYDSTLESSGAEVIFRFKGDGVLTLDMSRNGESSSIIGTWSESGETLSLTINGNVMNCQYTIEKDVLSIYFTVNGQNAVFTLNRI